MNVFKYIIIILSFAALMQINVSCKKETSAQNSIVGTWAYSKNGTLKERLQFIGNGSCIIKVIENGNENMQVGSYTISESNIFITIETIDQKVVHSGHYCIENNILQIDWVSIGFYDRNDKLERENEKKRSVSYKRIKEVH